MHVLVIIFYLQSILISTHNTVYICILLFYFMYSLYPVFIIYGHCMWFPLVNVPFHFIQFIIWCQVFVLSSHIFLSLIFTVSICVCGHAHTASLPFFLFVVVFCTLYVRHYSTCTCMHVPFDLQSDNYMCTFNVLSCTCM